MLGSNASSFKSSSTLNLGLLDIGKRCSDDCKKLWRDHRVYLEVYVRSCVDLALLARSVDERWKDRGPFSTPCGPGLGPGDRFTNFTLLLRAVFTRDALTTIL